MTTATRETVEVFGNVELPIPDGLRVLADGERHDPAAGEFLFTILTKRDGDKRLVWNRFNLAEVNAAREMFADLIAQGMTAHRVVKGKPVAERLAEFDPSAEELSFADAIVFLPMKQVVGG